MAKETDILKRYFLITLISVFVISGLLAGITYIFDATVYSYRFMWTLLAVFVYGIVSILSLRLSSQKDFSKYFSYISLAFATIAFVISMLLIWEVFTGASDGVFKTLAISLIATVYLSILGLVSGKLPNKVTMYAFFSSLGLMVTGILLASYLIIFVEDFSNTLIAVRVFWAVNILALVGVITTAISRRI